MNDQQYEIYHILFPTQYALTSTLMRFQEHYESPVFRNQIFTREEYMDWYAHEHNDVFSYFQDWSGFNFPSTVLEPFIQKRFSDLTEKENEIVNLFKDLHKPTTRFYVIATYKGSAKKSVIAHELVHALYYTIPDYADVVNFILEKHYIENLYSGIRAMGYHDEVVRDEANAYIITGLDDSLKALNVETVKHLRQELKSTFKNFFHVDPETPEGVERLMTQIKNVSVFETIKTTFKIDGNK